MERQAELYSKWLYHFFRTMRFCEYKNFGGTHILKHTGSWGLKFALKCLSYRLLTDGGALNNIAKLGTQNLLVFWFDLEFYADCSFSEFQLC